MSMDDLQERIDQLQGGATMAGEPEPVPNQQESSEKKKA
jgi:hypothetical protein